MLGPPVMGSGHRDLVLEGAWIGATVQKPVLSGDEPRVRTAQKGASGPELGRCAKAARRIRLGHDPELLSDLTIVLLGLHGCIAAQPIGVERPRKQVVDRHPSANRLARKTRHK